MTTTRKNDPEHITLSKTDFIEIARNGGSKSSGVKDWIRVIVAVAMPMVILITLFNRTSFQVERNTDDIVTHQEWINAHGKHTAAIQASISEVGKQQAVILEKIESVRKDVERLNRRQD